MRRLASYIRKYGEIEGRIIYRLLQSQAAHARWKSTYRDRLRGVVLSGRRLARVQ